MWLRIATIEKDVLSFNLGLASASAGAQNRSSWRSLVEMPSLLGLNDDDDEFLAAGPHMMAHEVYTINTSRHRP